VEHNEGDAEQALRLLEILLSVRNERENTKYPLESSCGLLLFDKSTPSLDINKLTAAADAKLYQVKEERRRLRKETDSALQLEEDRR
jgi:GGDEF domain-containing protein